MERQTHHEALKIAEAASPQLPLAYREVAVFCLLKRPFHTFIRKQSYRQVILKKCCEERK